MSIGIEHKLKGYLSRIERIKADGTREVISADIEVPNTIVNLGRRMVSGEWLHKFAGDDIDSQFKKNYIYSFGASIRGIPGIGLANTIENSGYNYHNIYNNSNLNRSEYLGFNAQRICFPGSYIAISSDGRDTSLEDTFDDYKSSLIKNTSGNFSETLLKYRGPSNGQSYSWYSGARVYTDYEYTQNDDNIDFLQRNTFRSIAVSENTTVRSILMCALKQNLTYPNYIPNNDNKPKLFSRIVLPEPIELQAGERLMITYDFHIVVSTPEVLGSMNGINYSIKPFVRGALTTYNAYNGKTSNYLPQGGDAYYSELNRSEAWVAPNESQTRYTITAGHSFTKPPLFVVDDLMPLMFNWNVNNNNSWSIATETLTSSNFMTAVYPQSGILTSSVHSRNAIAFADLNTSSQLNFTYVDRITPNIPCNAGFRNIVFQNYPGCPKTMMRGLDWQLTPDGKATFESCYAIQPTAGAMNIYGLLAHGAIVCFGKYDENGTWIDEPIVKSATQKAMISLKTIWNFD